MLARAGRRTVRLRSTSAAPSKSKSTPLLNIVLHEPQIPGNTGTAARKTCSQPLRPTRSTSPLACSGLLWRPWQLTVPPIRRVSPRHYWQAGSRHALPTAPRRATWLLTGRGEVQARRPPAELAPRRALHLHVTPRRAGLDYWPLVDCVHHATWEDYLAAAAQHGPTSLAAAAADSCRAGCLRAPSWRRRPIGFQPKARTAWARTAAREPLRGPAPEMPIPPPLERLGGTGAGVSLHDPCHAPVLGRIVPSR